MKQPFMWNWFSIIFTGGPIEGERGVCIHGGFSGKKGQEEIIIKSIVIDGNVLVDFGVLLHEMGHGFDNSIGM